MHTRSGADASPYKDASGGSNDNDDDDFVDPHAEKGHADPVPLEGLRRGTKRAANRQKKVSFEEAEPSSSKAQKSPVKKSAMKKSTTSVNKSPTKKAKAVPRGPAINANQSQAVPPFQHRFSVHRIRTCTFTRQQKRWITEAGFGSLLHMSAVSLPVNLVAFVMKNTKVELRQFFYKNRFFAFDKQLICNILGVPSGREPVLLSCGHEEHDDFEKIRKPFMGASRSLTITDCKEYMMKKAKGKTNFLRAFMLVALATVLCPTNDNYVPLKYLHSLKDVSKIRSYDWAGHILDELLGQIQSFQDCVHKAELTGVPSSPYLAHCLIIPAIAYMDYLDIPLRYANHKINYAVPRICHVSNEDFEFVAKVDTNRLQLNAPPFGALPLRKTSPYPNPVPLSGYDPPPAAEEAVPPTPSAGDAVPPPPAPEDETVVPPSPAPEGVQGVHVQPSLNTWLNGAGSSSHTSTEAPFSVESLPEDVQFLIAQHNSLVENDFTQLSETMKKQYDDLAQSWKHQAQDILSRRSGELVSKVVLKLSKHTSSAGDFRNKEPPSDDDDGGDDHGSDDDGSHGAPEFPSFEQPSSPAKSPARDGGGDGGAPSAPHAKEKSATSPSSSPKSAAAAPSSPPKSAAAAPSSPLKSAATAPSPPKSAAAPSMPSSSDIPKVVAAEKSGPSSEERQKSPIPPLQQPSTTIVFGPRSRSPSYIDDIPSLDILAKDDELYDDVCGAKSRAPHTPSPTRNPMDAPIDIATGSSTIELRDRKKRAKKDTHAIPQPKRPKPNWKGTTKQVWETYLSRRAFKHGFKTGDESESPPFIGIGDYCVTYDEFYTSFKAKGWISNFVMVLWCNQFNIDYHAMFDNGQVKLSRYAFPPWVTGPMSFDPKTFKPSTNFVNMCQALNARLPMTKLDLIFFPILAVGTHWVLVCICKFQKEIQFFDSMASSESSKYLNHAKNLRENFLSTMLRYHLLKDEVLSYKWAFPESPKQNNTYDCGIYTMDFMESWDGKRFNDSQLDVPEDMKKAQALAYRKRAAALLLHSDDNTIKLADFTKNAEEALALL